MNRLVLALAALLALPLFVAPTAYAQESYSLKKIRSTRSGWWDIQASYPRLRGRGPLVRRANAEIAAWVRQSVAALEAEAKRDLPDLKKAGSAISYGLEIDTQHVFVSPRLVSVVLSHAPYTGGAHPGFVYRTFAYELRDGKAVPLRMAGLFSDGASSLNRLAPQAIEKLRKAEAQWVLDGEVKTIPPGEWKNFAVDKDGVRVLFDPYAMGPWAQGPIAIRFAFAELGKPLRLRP